MADYKGVSIVLPDRVFEKEINLEKWEKIAEEYDELLYHNNDVFPKDQDIIEWFKQRTIPK